MSTCTQHDLFGEPTVKIVHTKHTYSQARRIVVESGPQVTLGVTDDSVVYAEEISELERLAPRTRGECHEARRAVYDGILGPCPWMRCRHHLLIDADTEYKERPLPFEHYESCALDVADDQPGGLTDLEVGELLGLTDERARQIGEAALVQLRRKPDLLIEYEEHTTITFSQMERF